VFISGEYNAFVAAVANTLTTGLVTLWKIDVHDDSYSMQLPWQHVASDIHCVIILAESAVEKRLLETVSARFPVAFRKPSMPCDIVSLISTVMQ